MAKRKRVDHHLISLRAGDAVLHAYLISNDRGDIERAMSRMIGLVEEAKVRCLPCFLVTPLDDDGVAIVEAHIAQELPSAKSLFAKVKDFHVSIFIEAEAHAKDLMALH
jgi:hypothetical protein